MGPFWEVLSAYLLEIAESSCWIFPTLSTLFSWIGFVLMMGYGLRIRRVYKPGVDCRDYGLVLRPVGFDVYSHIPGISRYMYTIAGYIPYSQLFIGTPQRCRIDSLDQSGGRWFGGAARKNGGRWCDMSCFVTYIYIYIIYIYNIYIYIYI